MTSILKLRGAPALSSSRQERLSRAVGEVLPKLAGLAAEHWYFVEVSAPLDAEETARLVDLLELMTEKETCDEKLAAKMDEWEAVAAELEAMQ